MKVLVVGGAGYIGSHTSAELLKLGHSVTILDNFANSDESVINVLKTHFGNVEFINADLRDYNGLEKALSGYKADVVIHFAAFIEVGRSVQEPAEFFENNVNGSQNLFKVLDKLGIKRVVFSSSAAVYGAPKRTPIEEIDSLNPENPYATSKVVIEELLKDYCRFAGFKGIALRYFNPAGGMDDILGESHKNESHLIPRLLSGIINPDFEFTVYGNDYPTPDGSAIRDYIHILDLVDAHVKAIQYLDKVETFDVYNVGTGKGYSVFEVIKTAEQVTGKAVSIKVVSRRAGDSPILIANPNKIQNQLGWVAKYNLHDIIESAWKWIQKQNQPKN